MSSLCSFTQLEHHEQYARVNFLIVLLELKYSCSDFSQIDHRNVKLGMNSRYISPPTSMKVQERETLEEI